MSYRDCELNPELACYLLTVMRKAFQNFACGQSSFNENILKNMEIRLPVDSNDNIDYTYITTFIQAQEKLSIKNVIDWKNKIINTSKKCIKNKISILGSPISLACSLNFNIISLQGNMVDNHIPAGAKLY